MQKKNNAVRYHIKKHAKGRVIRPPANEMTWKNVFKMQPRFMTTILLRFSLLDSHRPYPFNATSEPGYVYHCHILDHEDKTMMRPLKIILETHLHGLQLDSMRLDPLERNLNITTSHPASKQSVVP